jgi:hypothetical protein
MGMEIATDAWPMTNVVCRKVGSLLISMAMVRQATPYKTAAVSLECAVDQKPKETWTNRLFRDDLLGLRRFDDSQLSGRSGP